MRGLIEFAEAEFEKNESFKNAKVAEEAGRRIKHQQIHGDGWKKEQGPEVVSRIDKWEMVLDLQSTPTLRIKLVRRVSASQ